MCEEMGRSWVRLAGAPYLGAQLCLSFSLCSAVVSQVQTSAWAQSVGEEQCQGEQAVMANIRDLMIRIHSRTSRYEPSHATTHGVTLDKAPCSHLCNGHKVDDASLMSLLCGLTSDLYNFQCSVWL